MNARWRLWVEGPGDKALVKYLLRHLKVEDVEPDCLHGGVDKLANIWSCAMVGEPEAAWSIEPAAAV